MRGGRAGAGMRTGGIAGGAGRGPTPPGIAREAEEKAFSLHNLRIVLFTDRGMIVADPVPVGLLPKDNRGWTPVAVPLSQFQGVQDATTVRAVGIFADESDVFYLGRARLIIDHTPVDVTAKAEPSITLPDQLITLSAELRGGPIVPRISWDFDQSDGIQEQALGPSVKCLYKKPGDYLVTCTVTDRAGVRSPVVKAVGIRIESSG